MPDQFKIRPAHGTWVVRAGGAVIGESKNALELSERDLPEVIYFPRADLAMAFLESSDTTTRDRLLGDASHFNIVTKSRELTDAGWSFEAPNPAAAAIRYHIAFRASDTVTVEQI